MYDLLQAPERDRLALFFEAFLHAISDRAAFPRQFPPVLPHEFRYEPGTPGAPADLAGKKILVLTDAEDPESNLSRMTSHLLRAIRGDVTVVNLHEISIRGGCVGCLQCALDYECVYRDKDEIPLGVAGRKLFRDEVWGNLQMVFQADHRYYRSHGLYDFPRRSLKTRIVEGSMMLITRIPSFRREFRSRIEHQMIRPFQHVLEDH